MDYSIFSYRIDLTRKIRIDRQCVVHTPSPHPLPSVGDQLFGFIMQHLIMMGKYVNEIILVVLDIIAYYLLVPKTGRKIRGGKDDE